MSKIRLLWKDIQRTQWDKVALALPRCNLFQDWDYGEAASLAENVKIHRGLIYRNQKPIGLVQGLEKRYLLGLKLVRFIRGPLFLETATPAERLRCYEGIKKSCRLYKGQLATIIPELSDNETTEKILKSAGLNRILSGMETNWLDLTKSVDVIQAGLSKSWQRDIKQAEKHKIAISFEGDLALMLSTHIQDQSIKKYHADNPDLIRALPKEKLVIANAIQDGEIAASALFIRHGQSATYQIGWSGDAARQTNAQKTLLWHSVLRLKESGVKWLDMGALDAKSAPGVTKFKQGLGGDAFILSGTYI